MEQTINSASLDGLKPMPQKEIAKNGKRNLMKRQRYLANIKPPVIFETELDSQLSQELNINFALSESVKAR